jgi:hypothetical protein
VAGLTALGCPPSRPMVNLLVSKTQDKLSTLSTPRLVAALTSLAPQVKLGPKWLNAWAVAAGGTVSGEGPGPGGGCAGAWVGGHMGRGMCLTAHWRFRPSLRGLVTARSLVSWGPCAPTKPFLRSHLPAAARRLELR